MHQPLVFDIKRYCINDGPGIRITIFFKGCPLSCHWCHNPESISPKVEKLYTVGRCIHCNACVYVCPEKACDLTNGGIVTDPDLCTLCGKCADICPTRAIEMSGRPYSVHELLLEIEKEVPFFDSSGGGVTFSGGEPLLHPEFLIAILDECGEHGIHRAVDTYGCVAREVLLEVARHTDLFLYDLKLMDPERHRQWTGVSNEKILANLVALAETAVEIQIRVPLIAGVNDDEANITAMADFIAALPGGPRPLSLLPYHGIAAGKHAKLGRIYDEQGLAEPSPQDIGRVSAIFAARGIRVSIGG
ncbi:MAG: glycyl-radical enzyme activating protein [Desulfuromonas sp.]|nr:MAG: glycyl-radical enzyme activating protein [Desulfuromonas sp.]